MRRPFYVLTRTAPDGCTEVAIARQAPTPGWPQADGPFPHSPTAQAWAYLNRPDAVWHYSGTPVRIPW